MSDVVMQEGTCAGVPYRSLMCIVSEMPRNCLRGSSFTDHDISELIKGKRLVLFICHCYVSAA